MEINRSATGESWQEIMVSIQTTTECDPESRPKPGDDCSSWVAVPYFIAFVALCSFLVHFELFDSTQNFRNL